MWEDITYDSSKSITLIATSLLSSLSNLQIRRDISTVCKCSLDFFLISKSILLKRDYFMNMYMNTKKPKEYKKTVLCT